jgi:Cobalt uptake substrate-specific transmembrane region
MTPGDEDEREAAAGVAGAGGTSWRPENARRMSHGVLEWSSCGRRPRRGSKQLNQRTVPLLAIFAALCFTIMMFNVPVPGGTTAHGVGGTLVAIVLGPSDNRCIPGGVPGPAPR